MRYPVLYDAIESPSMSYLIEQVQSLINLGWEPQGGVSVSQSTRWVHRSGMPDKAETVSVYCQALVFYAETDSESPTIQPTGEDNA